jgi:uncharacterized coiled-coil protein SlyX
MSLFDKLKGVIFEEVPDSAPSTPVITEEKVVIQPSFTQSQPQADPEIEKHFKELLESANLPGVDYYEFKKAVSAMPANGIPEQSIYQSTFTALSMAGATKEGILSAIDTYLNVINEDLKEFATIVSGKLNNEVVAKRNTISTNQKKIDSLNEEIQKLQQQNMQLQNEAMQNEIKINNTNNVYNVTAKNLVAILEGDKIKITQYIS